MLAAAQLLECFFWEGAYGPFSQHSRRLQMFSGTRIGLYMPGGKWWGERQCPSMGVSRVAGEDSHPPDTLLLRDREDGLPPACSCFFGP